MLRKSGKLTAILMAGLMIASPLTEVLTYADELETIMDENVMTQELSGDSSDGISLSQDTQLSAEEHSDEYVEDEVSATDAVDTLGWDETGSNEIEADSVTAKEPEAPATNGKVLSFFDSDLNHHDKMFQKNQHVFFGQKKGYFIYDDAPNKDIPRWRILNNKKANDKQYPAQGTPGYMFVMSEKLWGYNSDTEDMDNHPGNIVFGTTKIYQGSHVQSIVKDFWDPNDGVEPVFSEVEQQAITGFDKEDYLDKPGTSDEKNKITPFGPSELTKDDKVFLMSVWDMYNYVSAQGTGSDGNRSANYKDKQAKKESQKGTQRYWLRSPYADSEYDTYVAVVTPDGGISSTPGNREEYDKACIRPAFNIAHENILLASAAVGGKPSGAVGENALTAVKTGNIKDWKLTLKDSSRAFKAGRNDGYIKTDRGGKVGIHFEGAKEGKNEYVSAMLCDSTGKDILYYGRLVNNKKTGDVNVVIPSGLAVGNYVLKVFSEQYNGDRYTDYASDPATFTIEVDKSEQKITTSSDSYNKKVGDKAFNINAKTNGGGKLTYSSSNTKVVKVDASGKVTIVGVGKAKITINAAATEKYDTAQKIIEIVVKKDITKAKISGIKKRYYNGKARGQKPVVKIGSKTLVRNKDYTIKYTTKDRINAGKVKYQIIGKGDYSGTINKWFRIYRAKNTLGVSVKKVSVKASEIASKKKTLKAKDVFKVKKAIGKVTYTKLSGEKKITVASNGKVTVKKGLGAGKYKVKVKVKAKGDKNHKSKTKTVTFTVTVK